MIIIYKKKIRYAKCNQVYNIRKHEIVIFITMKIYIICN